MSSPRRRRHAPRALLAAGLAAAALLVLLGVVVAPAPAFQGWLIGFACWSSVPIGALVLALIHALTGGRWGGAIATALAPAARSVPLLGLLFLPLAFGLPHLYPWAGDPGAASGSVARLYLNPPSYLARSAVALTGWAVLALVALRTDLRRSRLIAGLGLVFHGLAVSLVAVDWLLSVDPDFTSSDFAADVAIGQLLAALAWAALLQPADAEPARVADLAGLMLACALGVLYLAYMQYVVSWYGDLPEKAAWYLRRGQGAWGRVALASLAFGALLPSLALLLRRVRREARLLRWVGASVLLGLLLRTFWLLGPAFDPGASLAAAPLAVIAVGGVWVGLTYGLLRPRPATLPREATRGA